MNQTQKQNKMLTAEQVYEQKQREISPHVKRELQLSKRGVIEVMELYASQKTKLITEERDDLLLWKQQAMSLISPLYDYVEGHPEIKVGGSKSDFLLNIAKERDKALNVLLSIRPLISGTAWNVVSAFLNTLDTAKEGGE